MSALVINMHKGQRMDITVQMKDADVVLNTFKENDIRFDKKYTTIAEEGPSTITFKGVHSKNTQDKIADLLCELTKYARDGQIDNAYVKFISPRPKNTIPVINPEVPVVENPTQTEDDTL